MTENKLVKCCLACNRIYAYEDGHCPECGTYRHGVVILSKDKPEEQKG